MFKAVEIELPACRTQIPCFAFGFPMAQVVKFSWGLDLVARGSDVISCAMRLLGPFPAFVRVR